jgi:hypothetical protein
MKWSNKMFEQGVKIHGATSNFKCVYSFGDFCSIKNGETQTDTIHYEFFLEITGYKSLDIGQVERLAKDKGWTIKHVFLVGNRLDVTLMTNDYERHGFNPSSVSLDMSICEVIRQLWLFDTRLSQLIKLTNDSLDKITNCGDLTIEELGHVANIFDVYKKVVINSF